MSYTTKEIVEHVKFLTAQGVKPKYAIKRVASKLGIRSHDINIMYMAHDEVAFNKWIKEVRGGNNE